ncbi:uncharacterized protein OCT59_025897 [Rhizophagus irregularis]|uniref:uncharacterized protein n=1 Tax=Rhizophagus irregularis TaxID=588596 RepID=UPI000CC8A094|nr:hypothetical protein OCT59_025897 [Rhizophagus irregularis]
MTATLSVITLVVRLRESSHTAFGDAIYREKVSNENPVFGFKQFSNALHDYNEAFKEGDLVHFGGKFTIDDNKLMLLVEAACVLEPQLGRNGERLKWEPEKIPSTKPFVHITTSACEPLSTSNNMNFVKTKSLIYSPFHSAARYINFEIGYSSESKWLEYLSDKWSEFANFFVAGFLEAIYTDGSTTYVQIDAKLIDYDVRFCTSTSSNNYQPSPQRSTTNTFAQRRNKSTPNLPVKTHITPKSDSNTTEIENAYEEESDNDSDKEDTVGTNQSPIDLVMIDDNTPINANKTKKRQLSDLCDGEIDQPIKLKRSYNKKGGRGGRGKK